VVEAMKVRVVIIVVVAIVNVEIMAMV